MSDDMPTLTNIPTPSPDYVPTTVHYLGLMKNENKKLYMIEHAGLEIRVALDVDLSPDAMRRALGFAAERLLEQVRLRNAEMYS